MVAEGPGVLGGDNLRAADDVVLPLCCCMVVLEVDAVEELEGIRGNKGGGGAVVVAFALVGEVLLLLLPFPLLKLLLPGPAVTLVSPSSSALHAVVALEAEEGVDLLLPNSGRNLVVVVVAAAPAIDDAEAVGAMAAGGVPAAPAEDAAGDDELAAAFDATPPPPWPSSGGDMAGEAAQVPSLLLAPAPCYACNIFQSRRLHELDMLQFGVGTVACPLPRRVSESCELGVGERVGPASPYLCSSARLFS